MDLGWVASGTTGGARAESPRLSRLMVLQWQQLVLSGSLSTGSADREMLLAYLSERCYLSNKQLQ